MTERVIRNEDFAWVDDYIAHVARHFEVREADSLLIVMPNKAVSLNTTGLKVLRYLKDGGSIDDILAKLAGQDERCSDVYYFLCDFRSLMTGCLGEGRGRKAVEIVSHNRAFNVLPVLSEVAVTYRCNLRCQFCYAGCTCCGPRDANGEEMTTRQIARIFKIIRRDAGVPSVSFTGGEPLLRRDIVELTERAARTGLRVNLITNGTLLAGNDLAAALCRAGLSSAQVSLEGPTSQVHDTLTGVAGSFERTLAGLEALRTAGIHAHTNTTICRGNADHLVELVTLISSLGLGRMSMNMVIPAGTAADGALQIAYRDIGAIVERVRLAARSAGVEFMWYSPTPMCLYNPLAAGLGNKSCAACDGLLSISPTGDVLPCSSFAESVGNLLHEPFETVWRTARARFFRDKAYAPGECAGCEEFTACAGACPLYWSAMGTSELSQIRRCADAVA